MHCTWLLHVGHVAGGAEGVALVAVRIAGMRVHLQHAQPFHGRYLAQCSGGLQLTTRPACPNRAPQQQCVSNHM